MKEKAVAGLGEADAFVCITAKSLEAGRAEICVFNGGKPELQSTLANEMLILVRLMLFGEDKENDA